MGAYEPAGIRLPQVSYNTTRFMGQCVPAPTMGAVCPGAGAVCKSPTQGLPVLNPMRVQ